MIKIAKTVQEAKLLSREYQKGRLRRIYRGIYTDDLKSEINKIVVQNWMRILSHIVSQAILGFRTALELKPQILGGEAIIFVISSYVKTINLPGLTIKVYKGNNSEFIEQILPNLFRSNLPRALLENLTIIKRPSSGIKTIGISGVEIVLAKELRIRGEESMCAKHGVTLGGESPLWAVSIGTTSLGKGVCREAESEGSR